jgi:hypothetical protein
MNSGTMQWGRYTVLLGNVRESSHMKDLGSVNVSNNNTDLKKSDVDWIHLAGAVVCGGHCNEPSGSRRKTGNLRWL